jgi:hypothetical protein
MRSLVMVPTLLACTYNPRGTGCDPRGPSMYSWDYIPGELDVTHEDHPHIIGIIPPGNWM